MKQRTQNTLPEPAKESTKESKVVAIRVYGEDIEAVEWLAEHSSLSQACLVGIRASYQKLKPAHAKIQKLAREVVDKTPPKMNIRF